MLIHMLVTNGVSIPSTTILILFVIVLKESLTLFALLSLKSEDSCTTGLLKDSTFTELTNGSSQDSMLHIQFSQRESCMNLSLEIMLMDGMIPDY